MSISVLQFALHGSVTLQRMADQRGRRWTMDDVAAAAGVSRTTVSHTLSGHRAVNPETAKRIRAIIAQTGFQPDSRAQRLAGKSRIIGIVVPDISAPYFGRIARGAEEVAHEREYALVVGGTAEFDPQREHRYFDMLRNRMLDGLIYHTARANMSVSDLLSASEAAPIVLADEPLSSSPDSPRLPIVMSANREGGRQLGAYLAELGHSEVVVLSGILELPSQMERLEGIREYFPDTLVLSGAFDVQSGIDLVRRLLKHGLTSTAIVCGNDMIATGAIRALQEAGLRVPEDVSVTGWDDLEIGTALTPSLTTVRTDALRVGRESVLTLLDQIENGSTSKPSINVIPCELVVRQSTAPPPKAG